MVVPLALMGSSMAMRRTYQTTCITEGRMKRTILEPINGSAIGLDGQCHGDAKDVSNNVHH